MAKHPSVLCDSGKHLCIPMFDGWNKEPTFQNLGNANEELGTPQKTQQLKFLVTFIVHIFVVKIALPSATQYQIHFFYMHRILCSSEDKITIGVHEKGSGYFQRVDAGFQTTFSAG